MNDIFIIIEQKFNQTVYLETLKIRDMKNLILITVIIIVAMNTNEINAQHELPKLQYEYEALEPHIDAKTMKIHHTRHHQGYVNNLNAALKGTDYEKLELEELMIKISNLGTAIRNNGGGHYNHNLFWEILSPKAKKAPEGELLKLIDSGFGGLENLKKELNQASMTRFGSGWGWLIVTPDKKLRVVSTPNQDNPLMDIEKVRGIPIIGIDVWEHAYYLNYQNRRADYLDSIWEVIDWAVVEKKFKEAINSPLLQMLK